MTRFQFASMRRFALGVLHYTPNRFGLMRVGDFLDAMQGYQEGENERAKSIAEIIRTSTTLLWNVHQVNSADLRKPMDLWPLPWDKQQEEATGSIITDEERARAEETMERKLKEILDGNSNKQSKGTVRG